MGWNPGYDIPMYGNQTPNMAPFLGWGPTPSEAYKGGEEPPKIKMMRMFQNMEGLVSEKSIEKVKLLNEYTQIDNIILMNLTETWLDNTVEDVVEIEGYNLFRGDRNGKIRGGTAIYLHDKIEANKICEMSYEK